MNFTTFAIRVPSSWNEELRNNPKIRYKNIHPPRTNRNTKSLPVLIPTGEFYRKPNVLLKPRKSSWKNVPVTNFVSKFSTKSTPYRTIKQFEQNVPSSSGAIQPEVEPVVNYAGVKNEMRNQRFPMTENLPSFTTIIPPMDSYQIFTEPTSSKLPDFTPKPTSLIVTPSRTMHHPFISSSNKKSQAIHRQNQLNDFISNPSNFQVFEQTSIDSSHKSPQEKPSSYKSTSSSFPPQNFDRVFMIPTNHKSQSETTEQTTVGRNLFPPLNFDQTFNIPFNPEFVSSSNNHNNYDPKSHLLKNYRDDMTHEPVEFDPFLDNEATPAILRDESEKAPISTHEYPADIPTKPIYPGEGLWATRGLKHKPFISKQKYESLEKDANTPNGYDTFIEGEKMFNQQHHGFNKHLDAFPKKHNLESLEDKQRQQDRIATKEEAETVRDEETTQPADKNGAEDSEHGKEFVPMKLYAQVRHSEDIEHLPTNDDENGRLREAIKESKIQTVYTEEGYEDDAYDHEGHEKEAENKEEFEELERGQEKTAEKKVPHKKYNLHLVPKIESTRYSNGFKLPTDQEIEDYKKMQLGLDEDSDIAGSQYEEPSVFNISYTGNKSPKNFYTHKPPKIENSNNFMSTKEIKTMTTKEKDDGDTETEISSRIKVIMHPNNTAKAHEFIKIHPKVYKNWKKVPSSSNAGKGRMSKVEPILTGEITKPNKQGIYIEEIITTSSKPLLSTLPTTEFPDILSEEIPITTLPTTAIPSIRKKSIHNEFSNVHSNPSGIDIRSRKKRFVNDFPNIHIDNGFISKISHELVGVPDDTKAKYPYYENYKRIDLNENSPLRYSEDLNNMPMKSEGRMSFYDQADSRIECPEIESTVEPIPERVIKVGEEQSDDEYDNNSGEDEFEERKKRDTKQNLAVAEQPKGPRLNRLGDKIDCLKARYFGENPLDSPFFEEDTISPVKPIFKNLIVVKSNTENDNPDNVSAETQNPTSFLAENEIINDMDKKKRTNMIRKFKVLRGIDENSPNIINSNSSVDTNSTQIPPAVKTPIVEKVPDAPIEFDEEKLGLNVLNDISKNMKSLNHSHNNNSTQIPPTMGTKPTISLLTTPEYTIDLKPKHIYDQINLLNYLPKEQSTTNNESETNVIPAIPRSEVELIADNETAGRDRNDMRQPKSHEAEEQDNLTYDSSSMIDILPDAEALKKRRKFRIRRKRPGFQIFDVNKFIPRPYTIQKGHLIPTSGSISKGFQIFDVNKFLPTPNSIIADFIASSTVLPKYKIISEVSYKDDIKPNEQLNVFTDILNNIRNSSGNIARDSSQESSHMSIDSNGPEGFDRTINSHEYDKDTYLNAYNDQQVDDKYYPSIVTTIPTTTSTHEPKIDRGTIRFSTELNKNKPSTTHRPVQSNDKKLKLYAALLEAKLRQSNELQNNLPGIASTTPSLRDTYPESYRTTVGGMNPPGSQRYKTLYHPKRDNNMHLSIPAYRGTSLVNKYIVMGMKPPPRQRVLLYSDFLLHNNHLRQRNGLLRSRRSTNRAAYAEVSRNKASLLQDDEIENDDDEDDYVPHRPKNYFYDEKTGKIIYNNVKTPQDEDEDSEVEYIEITEPPRPKTTSKPKQNPIFATATPPPEGQSYVDFVKKLKNAADYKFIPDPTTTEKNAAQSTEQITTLSPISTTPPEFLSILAKIRETNDYRIIKDPMNDKSTTTRTPEEVVEEVYGEETAPIHLGNSPGGEQHSLTNDFQIFDISDYIPKLKNYLPRTSIDYSKYKTIERPAAKNYPKSEEDSDEPEKPSAALTQDISDNSTNIENVVSKKEERFVEDDIPVTTTTTTTTTAPIKFYTTAHNRRRRPTTLKSSRTSAKPTPTKSPTLATAESQEVRNEKPRRNYRRRPTRIKSTTERLLGHDIDETTKILRRRKIDENTSSKIASDEKSRKIETGDYLNDKIASNISNPVINHPEKLIEVFQEYNQENEHGGNYRKEDVRGLKKELLEPVSGASRRSKDVEIISEFDKTKRHGGNFKSENEDYVELTHEEKLSDSIKDSELEALDSDKFKSEDQPLTIQLLPKYKDELTEKKRDVKPEHDERSIQNTNEHRKRNRITRKYKKYPRNQGPVGRLTDVVPKPESFYSDPHLPRSINLLMIAQPMKIEDDYPSEDTDEIDIAASTEKPSFIKDPSERLYYYAPV
ncbi:unnamed protein product [Phaedon cochleariae]|uniref:Uncharacterized protein n=1 Tax=Phaedon cochleariae TaxID=80249 RepID=A0A9N9SBT8_PHACE|nr:unnamed protein product [Phaedon cochleariae]